MDPGIYFWSASLALFSTVVLAALAGWRAIRRQDVRAHKRWMNASILLVLLFVAFRFALDVWRARGSAASQA